MADNNNNSDFFNKRNFSRIKLIDPIRLIKSEYTFEEYMGNLSKTGCMILGLNEFKPGENVKVAIKNTQEEYIQFNCNVKRCQEKSLDEIEAEERGIKDLLFVDDDPSIRETFEELLSDFMEDNSFLIAKDSEEGKEADVR